MKNIYKNDTHRISVLDDNKETKKEKKKKENNRKRKKVEKGGVEYGQDKHLIATDSESISKIVSTANALDQGIISKIKWKAMNGWINNVDSTTMMDISTIVTKHIQESFSTEREIEEFIDTLTEDELDQLNIEDEWNKRFGY
ncbi:hypothetical protein PBI_SCTP2_165 [Salicola phage SCTP-2]|nr:hypothetical protein PBI_SCTP2_165 [Salicola phage SCTP-2]